jgi:acyl-CoA thioester hydrolase
MSRQDFRFAFAIRVRFPEIDSQAVVFNSRYLEYFDLGIVEYFRDIGLFGSGGPREGPEIHVVKATVEFRAPILLDERIDVCVRCARIGRTSMSFALELHGAGTDDLRASGEEIYVHVSGSRGRPMPWKHAVIDALQSYEGRPLLDAR